LITDRIGTLHYRIYSKGGRGIEGNMVPSKCNSKAQLGPKIILEGKRGRKGPLESKTGPIV
jgi:hypothetical protein